jgi:hypothetical protein
MLIDAPNVDTDAEKSGMVITNDNADEVLKMVTKLSK